MPGRPRAGSTVGVGRRERRRRRHPGRGRRSPTRWMRRPRTCGWRRPSSAVIAASTSLALAVAWWVMSAKVTLYSCRATVLQSAYARQGNFARRRIGSARERPRPRSSRTPPASSSPTRGDGSSAGSSARCTAPRPRHPTRSRSARASSPAAAASCPAESIEQIDGGSKVIGLRVERESIRTFL